ncbi:hypothetical protein V8E36_000171 [Tilletia maclaganii]
MSSTTLFPHTHSTDARALATRTRMDLFSSSSLRRLASASLFVTSSSSSSSCCSSRRILPAATTHLRPTSSARTMASSSSSDLRPIVLCGPSGVGKSTLLKRLFNQYPEEYGFSVSHTTRAPRPGETPGESYHYVTREAFEKLIEQGAFLEHAKFGGNRYGTTAKAVEEVSKLTTKEGKRRRAVLDIDAQGVRLIKQNHAYLNPIFIFISPPSFSALRERLSGRGTETPDSIRRRIGMAAEELAFARTPGSFDAVVVNDNLDRAYELLRALIRGERTSSDELPPEEKEAESAARKALEEGS